MAKAIPIDDLQIYSRCHYPDLSELPEASAFLIHKPKSWTSFDVIRKLRNVLNISKMGHAGTLDPMATGLLIVCCGKATKSISQFQELPKVYKAEITFGSATASYDAETEVVNSGPYDHIKIDDITAALEYSFSGEIQQIPPMYSALKHKGKPLYKLARKGKTVKRYPRSVVIHSSEVLKFNPPRLRVKITCSKGTYIRSIAHDLGKELNTYAHLSGLKRTAIGSYSDEDALRIDELEKPGLQANNNLIS